MGGKHVDHEASGLNANQSHPNSKWGILHVLKYHKWRYVRKRNPHKTTKNETPNNDSHPPDASTSKEHKYAEHKAAEKGHVVEEKASKSGGTKHSVKDLIKKLLTDDKYNQKKGQHHRTASVPHLGSHVEPSSDLEAKARTVEEKLDIAKQTLVQHKLKEEEELKTDTSASESKEALEALNIINLNKESLMKILQNQNPPMDHHSDGKIGNSNSFSSPDRSSRGGFGLLKFKSMKEMLPQASEYKKDWVFRRSRSMIDNSCSSPSSVPLLKKTGESQRVSRFKGLQKKIKQVLQESRKDKQRITMDAVLHKVPPGDKFSKETKKEVSEQLKHPVLSGDGKHSPKATRPHHIRRTSSLRESVDRYCQLFEATNKEINSHGSERERPKPRTEEMGPPNASKKYLTRIYSLPDMQYFLYQNEDSSDAFSASIKAASNSAKHRLDEKKGVEDNSIESKVQENSVEVHSHSPAASNDENAEMGLHIDDSGSLGEEDGTSQHEHGIEPKVKPSLKPEELSPVSKPDSGFADDVTISTGELEPLHFPPEEIEPLPNQQHKSSTDTPKTAEGIGKVEIPSKKIHDIPRLRVEENNIAEFQYVRDVLELSGFSGTEALGEWHADDQPLDPCMYDEVEGYLVLDPECSENEGTNSHQLVLFDLINEMLMEIYERTCSYIPMRLSSACHIHHLPQGHCVLEEVWEEVRWYLSFKPEPDQLVEYVVAKDLLKNDGWVNLQSDSECVGLELESLIFDDILDESIWE